MKAKSPKQDQPSAEDLTTELPEKGINVEEIKEKNLKRGSSINLDVPNSCQKNAASSNMHLTKAKSSRGPLGLEENK